MIWYNLFGFPYFLGGTALFLSLYYGVELDSNIAALVAVAGPAFIACVVDRVSFRDRFVHFQTFAPFSEIRHYPRMRVAVFVGPVALWCVPAAILYPAIVRRPILESTLTLYFVIAAGVNVLVFFATLPLRVYDPAAESKKRREASAALRRQTRGGPTAPSAPTVAPTQDQAKRIPPVTKPSRLNRREESQDLRPGDRVDP